MVTITVTIVRTEVAAISVVVLPNLAIKENHLEGYLEIQGVHRSPTLLGLSYLVSNMLLYLQTLEQTLICV